MLFLLVILGLLSSVGASNNGINYRNELIISPREHLADLISKVYSREIANPLCPMMLSYILSTNPIYGNNWKEIFAKNFNSLAEAVSETNVLKELLPSGSKIKKSVRRSQIAFLILITKHYFVTILRYNSHKHSLFSSYGYPPPIFSYWYVDYSRFYLKYLAELRPGSYGSKEEKKYVEGEKASKQ